jgi:hypothetical protein
MTVKEYVDYARQYMKEFAASVHRGSEPKFLFKEVYDECWEFDPNNWNGCDVLRRFLSRDVIASAEVINGLLVMYRWIDDTTHFIIFDREGNFYQVSWYKNRGRTEKIYMNDKPIEIDEYVELCNMLGVTL